MKLSESYNYTGKPKLRQSNMELLRVIAMLLIVAHHFSVHGGFEFSADTITANRLWVQFFQIGGKIGVNIFVLISGYFLISSQSLKLNKVIKLYLQIFTYSVLFFIIFIALGIKPFSVKELIQCCFPVTFSQWWFASSYFMLYLLSPYINRLLNSLSKKEYQHLLMLLTICWCVIPTFTGQQFQSNYILWFAYLYSLAGYIKLHSRINDIKILPVTCFLLSALLVVLTFLSTVFFDIIGIKISFFARHATYFYDMQKLPILAIAVLMFIGFSKVDIGYRRIINIIASATFGVYLIHENRYVRPLLWKTVFKNASFSDDIILIPYSILVVALVFIVAAIIELLRIYILEKRYMGLVNSLAGVIDKFKEKLFSLRFFEKF